jgi:hypothetical protein
VPTKTIDLEVILGWVPEAAGFVVTVLYNAPGDHDDYRYFGRDPVRFDLATLAELKDNQVDDYGRQLGEMLFPAGARVLLDRALRAGSDLPVHLRLVIDPKAPLVYQSIRWETLCRPGSGDRLTTDARIRFSRFLSNPEGRQPSPLARIGDLDALLVVANPTDVGDYALGAVPLGAIDVQAEIERGRDALAGMSVTVLPDRGRGATRANIVQALSGRIHVLYLICHGRISERGPELLLESDDGLVDVVDGSVFAADVASLETVPTIVVLCSCESAGPGDARISSTAEDLAASGPAFAQAGALVVVAMQGEVTLRTAGRFLQRFFFELNNDGVPARAMAAARLSVRERPDWYMPVLYSRLKRGSAWYLPRFGGQEAKLFANLHTRIRRRHCTPIVGSGIAGEDGVLPSRQELADLWVTRRQMPISEVSRTDLASVAQFVRVEQEGGLSLVRDELDFLLRGELKERHAKALPHLDFENQPLAELVIEVGRHRRSSLRGEDGYSRLAGLDLPVYITTSWTGLLEDALAEAGKTPVTRHFDWRKSSSEWAWPYVMPAVAVGDSGRDVAALEIGGEEFDIEAPLVYHLSGTLEFEQTLVLTEDDYFAWLREWMKQVDNGAGIPGYVRMPLVTNSQLFLGYQFDDWEFRMIFQAIKGFQRNAQDGSPHVGVQLEPKTLRIEREAAQSYLESYFDADKISVYWQTGNTFLRELHESRPR